MMIGSIFLFVYLFQSNLVLGDKGLPINTESDEYLFPVSNSKFDTFPNHELNKRAFEALKKRSSSNHNSDEDYMMDELIEKTFLLKKLLKSLLANVETSADKRGFEALGKRSSIDQDGKMSLVDKIMRDTVKRGFEALGK